jgi:1-acyl-sn-glycerol-3-phosphate acyltransferase
MISGFKSSYAKQAFIIVANHSSHLDTPLLFSCFPFNRVNRLRAVAALDYFFTHTIVRVSGHLLCNIIPINRKSADFIAFSLCEKILQSDSSIIVYPEGTRTHDGKMGDFKAGIALLVKKTKAPVLPVYIHGTFDCLNRKRLFPRGGPIQVRFGEPVIFDDQQLRQMNHKQIAECIEQAVIGLRQ